MARRVFYSFHYKPDNWRASQVRKMGAIEGNRPATDNDWETIAKAGEARIKRWIAEQMYGKSCVVVLIGANTAGRKWINYEIELGWDEGKGIVGVYIHNLKNSRGEQAAKGANPFSEFTHVSTGRKMSSIVKAYDPPYTGSVNVYAHIEANLGDWVEEALDIRGRH